MGRFNKGQQIDAQGLKQILGRIFGARHPEAGDLPFLLIKERTVRVELDTVIRAIVENPTSSDQEIVGKMNVSGIKPSDIEIARAYIHRFGTDVANPLSIDVHAQKTLLLDENTPQTAMLPLSKSFGWATHVSAENLAGRNTPDESIWEFAQDKKFAAIVTRDTDFFYIQKHRGEEAMEKEEHVPLLIFVPETVSAGSLSALFVGYARDVQHHLKVRSLACSLAAEAGCHELHL